MSRPSERGNRRTSTTACDNNDGYEAKIRRKIEMEALKNSSTPTKRSSAPDISIESSLDIDAAKLKALKKELDDKKNRSRNRRRATVDSNRPHNLAASMPASMADDSFLQSSITSESTKSKPETFEEKIKRKLGEENNNSMSKTITSVTAVNNFAEKVKQRTEEKRRDKTKSSSSRKNRPKNLSASMPANFSSHDFAIGEMVEEGVESISFEDLYSDLRKLKRENSTLTLPISDPIIDRLSDLGIEELLRARWNDQFALVKAFKEVSVWNLVYVLLLCMYS